MPVLSLRRGVAASCLLAALAAAGACGTQGTGSAPPPVSPGAPSGQPTTSQPTGGLPTTPAAARQVFFDPSDLRTPQASAVLTQPAEVARFVAWLNSKPRPGMASDQLVAALTGAPLDGNVLLVVSRTVGCDSIGSVRLRQQGANYSIATAEVTHHQECLRANRLVVVFSVPRSTLPARPTIDGAAPDTSWR
jgi:hypothetical protein